MTSLQAKQLWLRDYDTYVFGVLDSPDVDAVYTGRRQAVVAIHREIVALVRQLFNERPGSLYAGVADARIDALSHYYGVKVRFKSVP
jgi:hypothetical protein